MKIVISGASSPIGASLADYAVQEGMEVLAIVRASSKNIANLPNSHQIKILYADLSQYSKIEQTRDVYDVFFHLAWDKTFIAERDDVDIQIENVKYTLDAVRAAQRLGCKVFIGVGSQAEYGISKEPLSSTTFINPQSGYGISKYAAGKMSALLCRQLGIRHNWVRILSVFGKLEPSYSLIGSLFGELEKGISPKLTKCEQTWDYLYHEDAARAFIAIAQKGIDGKNYPLGSGAPRKLLEYVIAIRNIIAPDIELNFGAIDYYPHQPMFLCADISELKADTGWEPNFSFEEAIKIIKEFRDEKNKHSHSDL
jgi:nucleoside-diphosphate-sugar epimerase